MIKQKTTAIPIYRSDNKILLKYVKKEGLKSKTVAINKILKELNV